MEQRAGRYGVQVTPPFKPYMEEKMWFALFWMRPLQAFWRRELGETPLAETPAGDPLYLDRRPGSPAPTMP